MERFTENSYYALVRFLKSTGETITIEALKRTHDISKILERLDRKTSQGQCTTKVKRKDKENNPQVSPREVETASKPVPSYNESNLGSEGEGAAPRKKRRRV